MSFWAQHDSDEVIQAKLAALGISPDFLKPDIGYNGIDADTFMKECAELDADITAIEEGLVDWPPYKPKESLHIGVRSMPTEVDTGYFYCPYIPSIEPPKSMALTLQELKAALEAAPKVRPSPEVLHTVVSHDINSMYSMYYTYAQQPGKSSVLQYIVHRNPERKVYYIDIEGSPSIGMQYLEELKANIKARKKKPLELTGTVKLPTQSQIPTALPDNLTPGQFQSKQD